MFAPTDYTFDLPPELIAQEPVPERGTSRLLHLASDGSVADGHVSDLVQLLPADAVLVVNDTRVIPARVLGKKASGGNVELLFLEPEPSFGPGAWRCLARARRPLKRGQRVEVEGASIELLTEREGDEGSVVVRVPGDALALLERVGHMPLPRYVHRPDTAADRERYQTIFAKVPGAVAAPTAGLHMTPAITEALSRIAAIMRRSWPDISAIEACSVPSSSRRSTTTSCATSPAATRRAAAMAAAMGAVMPRVM